MAFTTTIPSELTCPEDDIFSLPTKEDLVNALNKIAQIPSKLKVEIVKLGDKITDEVKEEIQKVIKDIEDFIDSIAEILSPFWEKGKVRNWQKEINDATEKLNSGGYLIIMAPAHQKIYGNLDKAVGHYRRYEKEFFNKKFDDLSIVSFKFLDSMGYILYFLNRIFFSKETFPSDLKIFLWDKIFTPLTILMDLITNYKFGKCIVAIYQKK